MAVLFSSGVMTTRETKMPQKRIEGFQFHFTAFDFSRILGTNVCTQAEQGVFKSVNCGRQEEPAILISRLLLRMLRTSVVTS